MKRIALVGPHSALGHPADGCVNATNGMKLRSALIATSPPRP